LRIEQFRILKVAADYKWELLCSPHFCAFIPKYQ